MVGSGPVMPWLAKAQSALDRSRLVQELEFLVQQISSLGWGYGSLMVDHNKTPTGFFNWPDSWNVCDP